MTTSKAFFNGRKIMNIARIHIRQTNSLHWKIDTEISYQTSYKKQYNSELFLFLRKDAMGSFTY